MNNSFSVSYIETVKNKSVIELFLIGMQNFRNEAAIIKNFVQTVNSLLIELILAYVVLYNRPCEYNMLADNPVIAIGTNRKIFLLIVNIALNYYCLCGSSLKKCKYCV